MAANNFIRLILCCCVFFWQSLAFAQEGIPLLERRITLEVNGELSENVLRLIEQKAGFTFSYSPQLLQGKKTSHFNFINSPVREVLHTLFSDQIIFKEKGRHVILLKNPVAKSDVSPLYYQISGYVVDGKNGNQISEVSVYEKKSRESSVSNQFGYFRLKVKKEEVGEPLQLVVNKSTYKDTIVFVRQTGTSLINITLYPLESDRVQIDSLSIQDSLMRVDQLAFVNLLLNKEEEINTRNVKDTIYRKFQASFLPYLGSNLRLSGNTVNDYSLNVLGGYSMGTRVLEIGGLFNVDRDSVAYVQIAGLGNIVGGPVQGVQIGGLLNYDLKTLKGVELAGLLNVNRDSVEGTQFSGLVNVNLNHFTGFQGSGFVNVNTSSSRACQAAGFLNVALAEMKGTQLAGFLNVSKGGLEGAQVSGFMNYASKVHGSQIGFINIADTISGVPVGFLSFVRQGYHQFEVSSNEVFPLNLSLRTGVSSFYNIIEAGMKLDGAELPTWAFGYGLGSAVHLGKKWMLDFDISVHQPMKGNEINNFNPLTKFNLTIEKRFSKFFTLAAGPSINTFFYRTTDPLADTILDDLAPSYAFHDQISGKTRNVSWFGGKVALRFF